MEAKIGQPCSSHWLIDGLLMRGTDQTSNSP